MLHNPRSATPSSGRDAGPPSKRRRPRIWTRETAGGRILTFAAQVGARFSTTQVARDLGSSQSFAANVLAMLAADGRLLRLPDRGAAWVLPSVEATGGTVPLTLSRLRELAADSMNHTLKLSARGRLSPEQRLRRREISRGQYRDILSMLGTVADLLYLQDDEPLGEELLHFDVDSGRWTGVAILNATYVESRMKKGQRRGRRPMAGPRSVKAARGKLATSLTLVLDLAANHGLLSRTNFQQPLPAAWLLWLPPTDTPAGRRFRVNARCLARIGFDMGMSDPTKADWPRVGARLRHLGDIVASRAKAKNAIRAFIALDLPGLPLAKGGRGARIALLPTMAIREASKGNWDAWVEAGLGSLVEGQGGLRQWQRHLTVTSPLERRRLGLPDQAVGAESPRRSSRTKDRANRPPTIEKKLRHINVVLGRLSNARGLEAVTTLTCADLIRTENAGAITEITGAVSRSGAALAFAGLARFLHEVALAGGAADEASRHMETAGLFVAEGIRPPRDPKARARATVAAWGGLKEAMSNAMGMRDLLALGVIDRAGHSVEEQLQAVRAGVVDWQTALWAVAVRDAVLIGLLLRIPLRSETLRGLRLFPSSSPEERATTSLWHPLGQSAPWEGGIQLLCPPGAMKSGNSFEPFLIQRDEVGNEQAEREVRRDLIKLYLHPNGARAFLLRSKTEDPGWLWLRLGGLQLRGVTLVVRNAIRACAPRLGVMFDALIAARCCGTHAFRHIFGSHFAPFDVTFASQMLHHADTAITEEVYSSMDEKDCNVDAVKRRMRATGYV